MSNNKKIMDVLQKMHENDLTKSIIIPLLENLGYFKVEFNGGVTEEGKDIIFWEKNKIDELKLFVAQVKHFKFTSKSASDSNSLQTIINQLTVSLKKPILYTNKKAYLPSEVMLISSYEIDTQSINSRFSAIPDLIDRKITIIDGFRLSELIIKHAPDLVKKILGKNVNIRERLKPTLNNEILLKALKFEEKKDLKNIYTDINFSLGKTTTELFFYDNFVGNTKKYNLTEVKWKKFIKNLELIEEVFGLNFLMPSKSEITSKFVTEKKLLSEWNKKHSSLERQIAKLQNLIKSYKNQEKKNNKLHDINKYFEDINKIKVEIKAFLEIKPKPLYKFSIKGRLLASIIIKLRNKIEKDVREFNKNIPSTDKLKTFFKKCNKIFNSANILFNKKEFIEALGISNNILFRPNMNSTRLKFSIDKIFDTGINITLLGEAGAGKTTNLQMYALNNIKNKDKFVFWLPLSQLVINWRKNTKDINDSIKIKEFYHSIVEYLNSKKISITDADLTEILKNQQTVLLLDGIDEAIKDNLWLPKAIFELSQTFPKSQIITSSRMSGAFFDDLPFFKFTLLPFTIKQRDDFISKWFDLKEERLTIRIKNHLKNNQEISNITLNPLLTTILCVLAKHNLPLPYTEINLYDNRLKLLAGYYDNVKNIKTRISTTPYYLELLAQKIAFNLHSKGIRGTKIETLKENAVKLMSKYLNSSKAKIALNELIDPCNIIVPMSIDGDYGFGHLRFQEHLAAKEINSNRNINILSYLDQDWWQQILIFFSQMNESLLWLPRDVGHLINNKMIEKTIDKMISTRPYNERNEIKRIFKEIKAESKEYPDYLDEYNETTFYDDIY